MSSCYTASIDTEKVIQYFPTSGLYIYNNFWKN